jgi:hypothetical protein
MFFSWQFSFSLLEMSSSELHQKVKKLVKVNQDSGKYQCSICFKLYASRQAATSQPPATSKLHTLMEPITLASFAWQSLKLERNCRTTFSRSTAQPTNSQRLSILNKIK